MNEEERSEWRESFKDILYGLVESDDDFFKDQS